MATEKKTPEERAREVIGHNLPGAATALRANLITRRTIVDAILSGREPMPSGTNKYELRAEAASINSALTMLRGFSKANAIHTEPKSSRRPAPPTAGGAPSRDLRREPPEHTDAEAVGYDGPPDAVAARITKRLRSTDDELLFLVPVQTGVVAIWEFTDYEDEER